MTFPTVQGTANLVAAGGIGKVPYTPWLQFSHPILLNIMGALHWLIVWLDVGNILSQ